jgi:DNA-binding MarR family transcriptional regulator
LSARQPAGSVLLQAHAEAGLAALTGRDLIDRHIDAADQRVVSVEATRSGRRVHERIRTLRSNVVAERLGQGD